MKVYAMLALIVLIGTLTILSFAYGLYFIASHEVMDKVYGVLLLILGVIGLYLWKHAVSYFGSRWSCF